MIQRLVVPRRFLITSPAVYGPPEAPEAEPAEIPNPALPESLGRIYVVEVIVGAEIEVPVTRLWLEWKRAP